MYATGYYATGYHGTGYYSQLTDLGQLFTRTYYTLLFEARLLLSDDAPDACYRYPDLMLINILNRGLHDLSIRRPDAFYDTFGANDFNVPEVTIDNWTDPFGTDLQFYDPLVQYVVGFAEVSEDEYAEDGRADYHLAMFEKYTKGL